MSFKLITQRRFGPLFAVQFCGAFNDNLLKYAILMLAAYQTAGTVRGEVTSQQLNLLASALFILPFFLFSATAGTLADKLSKSGLVRWVKLAEVFIMLISAAGFILLDMRLLLISLFFMGAQSALFGPLKYGLLPELLPDKEILPATSLVQAATFLAILLGTAGGGLLAKLPAAPYISAAAVLAVAGLGYLASLAVPQRAPAAPALKVDFNVLRDIRGSIGYAFSSRPLSLSVIGLSWFWLVGIVVVAILPPFTRYALGADQVVATGLIITGAVGVGIGALLCPYLLNNGRADRLPALAGTVVGFALIALGCWPLVTHFPPTADAAAFLALPYSWGVVATVGLFALACGLFTVPLFTVLQTQADKRHKARTIAANNIVNALFMAVGSLASGWLVGALQLPSQALFILAGVGTLGIALLMTQLRRASGD